MTRESRERRQPVPPPNTPPYPPAPAGCTYRASIDSEGAAVDVAGLSAFRVDQESSTRKVADQHALPWRQ